MQLRCVAGDRWKYFSTPDDTWAIVRTLAAERKRREVDPRLTMLRVILMDTPLNENERHARDRMRQMHELTELLTAWFAEVVRLDNKSLIQLLKLRSKVRKVLHFKENLRPPNTIGLRAVRPGLNWGHSRNHFSTDPGYAGIKQRRPESSLAIAQAGEDQTNGRSIK